jgi:hypothetical protein
MIELRVVENELGMRTDIQYRYHIFTVDASGALCPPSIYEEWSEWKTAEWVKAEDT